MKTGRPTLYSDAMDAHICELAAQGVPLHKFDERDDVPCRTTVNRWLDSKPEFCARYVRAREELADKYVAEVVSIADEANPETMRGIEHARTKIDARKWAAAKIAPKKYGDRLKQELSGPNDGPIEVADASSRLLDMLNRRAASKPGA